MDKQVHDKSLKVQVTKFWFDCDCGHEFESLLSNVTNKRWCPFCANQKLCENNDCKNCLEKSFESNPLSKYWSKKNGQTSPRQVFKSSHKKFWFDCDCGHEFESRLSNVTKIKLVPILQKQDRNKIIRVLETKTW